MNKYKVVRRSISYVNTFTLKFDIPTQYLGQKTYVRTRRVGIIPYFESNKDISEHPWPTFITAGDISRDGEMIIL